VSLLYCVSSVFCFCICFILLLRGPVFLTLNTKYALVRVQPDSIVTTSFKNKLKVSSMIHSLARVRIKILKVSFEYVLKIVKREIHGMLKGCSDVFKVERHFLV
jgi:hypothetical protein